MSYTPKEFMNTVAGAYFAGDYAGVTHAGIALVAMNTGRVFLTKRAFDETDAEDVAERWEFPGGGIDGDDPWTGALREFIEETGLALPDDAKVVNGWRSDNGVYQGFVVVTAEEFETESWNQTTEVQDIGWFDHDAFNQFNEVGALRPEMRDFDWNLIDDVPLGVSGNKEIDMSEMASEEVEPDLTDFDLATGPIPVHGVLAPEGTESGDGRGFNNGAMTTRPLRIPFSWQKSAIQGHDGSVQVGSVDRLMRKDGLIHWEGQLMNTDEADEYTGLLAFMGKSGVSVDGDKGSIDQAKTGATDVLWFDAVRSAGLTGVAIPAFHEAYAALGPHPDMPATDEEQAALTASGNMIGEFRRGPGWVTDPAATKRIHDYWMPGHPGGDKIAWGTPGDFARAKALIGEKIAKNSPTKVRFLNQIIAQWHHDALGYWPATHAKMERGGAKASSESLTFKTYTGEQRKKMAENGQALPDGSYPIADCSDLRNAIQSIGRASDPAKAKAHIRKRKAALGCSDIELPWGLVKLSFTVEPMADDLRGQAYCIAPDCDAPGEYTVSSADPEWWGIYCSVHAPEYEDKSLFDDYEDAISDSESIEMDDDGGWETVMVSSAHGGTRILPPASYFDFHPDSGALVIDEPDEAGIRRTYGYAGEWGVCHIGYDGKCIEVPDDEGGFPDFHLGRTKTNGGYINTGLITYKVNHRGKQRILSESAEQQHFDNVANAWAAVRLGVDERGIWFSGVVLPTVPEEDIVLIEAAGQVSGEWKRGALRALQAVNVPGFGVRRSEATYDEDGEVELLVASAFGSGGCEGTPTERMAALAQADAEARFENMKKEWN